MLSPAWEVQPAAIASPTVRSGYTPGAAPRRTQRVAGRPPAVTSVTSEGADEVGQHERPVALHGVAGTIDDDHLERGEAALHLGDVLVQDEGGQAASHEEDRDRDGTRRPPTAR